MTPEPVPQFTSQRRVEFADTDMAGIIHFSSYYRYMEECEHAYFRSLGFSIVHKLPDGDIISWPRVRTSCAYYAPVRFEDLLDIRLFVLRKGVKSLTYDIEFLHNGKRVARGSQKNRLLPPQTRTPADFDSDSGRDRSTHSGIPASAPQRQP